MHKIFFYLLLTSSLFANSFSLHDALFETDEHNVNDLLHKGADVGEEIGAGLYAVNEDGYTPYDIAIAQMN